MSTRATYRFTGFDGASDQFIYHHYDGYPSGAAMHLMDAAKKSWFSASALLSGFKEAISNEVIDSHDRHADTDYRWDLSWDAIDGVAHILGYKRCHAIEDKDSSPLVWKCVFVGTLPQFFAEHYSEWRPAWTDNKED